MGMGLGELLQSIFYTAVGGILVYWGWRMLTRPVLGNPSFGETTINVEIMENEDMLYDQTANYYYTGGHPGRPPKPYIFVYVKIENKPIFRFNSIAKGVSAEVTWIGRESGNIVSYFARPMGTPAPHSIPNYGEWEASRIDIPPGKPLRGFYIAFSIPGEEYFYGFSENSYQHYTYLDNDVRYYDWKNPELKLGGEKYDVSVTFDGENINPFTFDVPLFKKKYGNQKSPA